MKKKKRNKERKSQLTPQAVWKSWEGFLFFF